MLRVPLNDVTGNLGAIDLSTSMQEICEIDENSDQCYKSPLFIVVICLWRL